ncbi:MAG: tRNA (adenosine(37)-N6)-threonylcarbamoyltransferase complex ATPase subunit type 1 TsaE [Kyrpidia sp.]|nr:tRNA (adenosine(37)-N6)-threonylcarbamoyltransferase complex ATPase subunit type 1 TsaE [Kyrpidia sp.]
MSIRAGGAGETGGGARRRMWEITTGSPGETQTLGRLFGEAARPGTVLCLDGDLGAGKTTFVQGLADGLGVSGPVASPTFTLVCEYRGRFPLYHVDVYRLGEEAAEEPLGLEEYLEGDGVMAIEWSRWVEPLLPEDRVSIRIERPPGATGRALTLRARGSRHEALLEEVMRRWPG